MEVTVVDDNNDGDTLVYKSPMDDIRIDKDGVNLFPRRGSWYITLPIREVFKIMAAVIAQLPDEEEGR